MALVPTFWLSRRRTQFRVRLKKYLSCRKKASHLPHHHPAVGILEKKCLSDQPMCILANIVLALPSELLLQLRRSSWARIALAVRMQSHNDRAQPSFSIRIQLNTALKKDFVTLMIHQEPQDTNSKPAIPLKTTQ